MRIHKLAFSSIPVKKWSGGMFIMVLAAVLIICYSIIGIEPQNQSDQDISEDVTTSDSISEAKKVTIPWEKPHIVDFEGLNYLFSQNNLISQDDSTALLVWSRMRPFLARSDALQETAQGIKEAALAWKEFLYLIQEEETLTSKSNDTEEIESEKCRFSVEASVGKSVLQLPCGLVLDSSITAVGIPSENSTNFLIELVGKASSNRTNPPTILHYNVSPPGDNIMHDPSIVQNTWTEELGWGNEVRCPNHGSANSRIVDELPVCNDQTVRSVVEEIQNMSQPNGNVSISTSRGRTNFPFPEGNPFTATLWVGLEGFHMTVNGRHETSFAYREKLEPWSVSEVRVTGGLNILSMFATGLPDPENHGLTVDENLKAPSLPSKRLTLLIGVFSSGNNFARRMALRRSWMQFEAVRSGEVAVRFLIGFHKTAQVNVEMWRESKAYGDIQFMPFVDYYGLISLKTIALCILGTKIIPAKYVMKTDDDAFVRIDELLSSLKEKPSTALLYGLITPDSSPNREEDSKWYISEKEWPIDSYPPWAHGPGYVISRDIAKFVVKNHQQRDLRLFKLEDVAMGIWIQAYNSSGRAVVYDSDERFHNAGCDPGYILAHYQGPRLVLCLWEKLQKEHQPLCCE